MQYTPVKEAALALDIPVYQPERIRNPECIERLRSCQADVMVVIGGRNSANTTRLAEISAARCPRTHHVEGADELRPTWFEGAAVIGITAGASTPASQIEAVRTRIAELVGE